MEKQIFNAIKIFITCMVMGIWAVVGLFFWIPLLSRVILIYTTAVAAATFSRGEVGPAGEMLDKATSFYIYGFSSIWSHTFGNNNENGGGNSSSINGRDFQSPSMPDGVSFLRVALEAVYSLFFYFVVFSVWNDRFLEILLNLFEYMSTNSWITR
jgi:hypothetical protein